MVLGVLRILNVYDMTICMASGNNQCEIGFYKLGMEQGPAGISYRAIMGKHWTIIRPISEDRYAEFIMDVIEGLECALGVWLKQCSFRRHRRCLGMEPDLKSNGPEFKNKKINIPGVYFGRNIAWLGQNAPGMSDIYVEGATNAEKNIAYPFKITGNVCQGIPQSRKITAKAKGHITISASGIKGGVGMQVVPKDPKKFARVMER